MYLFCFVSLVHLRMQRIIFLLVLRDVICLLNGDNARCQYCFQNLYKDTFQNFNIKDGCILCQIMYFYFLQIYSIFICQLHLQHSNSWIKLSIFILFLCIGEILFPIKSHNFHVICFIVFFSQNNCHSAFSEHLLCLFTCCMPY